MFSAAELTRLRAAQTGFMPDTCSLQAYTAVSDAQGGWTDTWTTTQTGVPCRVAPGGLSPSERVIVQRLATERIYSVTLPAETVVTEKDRIIWSGHTLDVVAVGMQTVEIAVRVIVEKVA